MDGPIIINADNDEIEVYNNGDDGIIAVADIPHNNNTGAHATINNSDKNINAENDGDDGSDDNDSDNKEASNEHESDDKVSILGVRRSKQKTKGKTTRFDEYGLMMAMRRNARKSKKCRATIQDGTMFFLGNSLSNAKPIPEEDREE